MSRWIACCIVTSALFAAGCSGCDAGKTEASLTRQPLTSGEAQAPQGIALTAATRCARGTDCPSRYCLEVASLGYGKTPRVCTPTCHADTDCPQDPVGWTCRSEKSLAGVVESFCVPPNTLTTSAQ
jgi:hypothetical protein